MDIDDFGGTQPEMKPERYFLGETRGWGMFHDRFGRLRRQYEVNMLGETHGDLFVLAEDFVYDDGETEQRVWELKRFADGTYEGTAGDVIGLARGRAKGNAFNWVYQLNLKVGDSRWRVAFDDWLYLQPGGVLLNRATATRWGIEIGTLTATFHKRPRNQTSLVTHEQSMGQAAE